MADGAASEGDCQQASCRAAIPDPLTRRPSWRICGVSVAPLLGLCLLEDGAGTHLGPRKRTGLVGALRAELAATAECFVELLAAALVALFVGRGAVARAPGRRGPMGVRQVQEPVARKGLEKEQSWSLGVSKTATSSCLGGSAVQGQPVQL